MTNRDLTIFCECDQKGDAPYLPECPIHGPAWRAGRDQGYAAGKAFALEVEMPIAAMQHVIDTWAIHDPNPSSPPDWLIEQQKKAQELAAEEQIRRWQEQQRIEPVPPKKEFFFPLNQRIWERDQAAFKAQVEAELKAAKRARKPLKRRKKQARVFLKGDRWDRPATEPAPAVAVATVGELIDRLSIVNIKIYHLEDVVRESEDAETVCTAAKRTRELNRERSELKNAITLAVQGSGARLDVKV